MVEILVFLQQKPPSYVSGNVIAIRPEGFQWGRMEDINVWYNQSVNVWPNLGKFGIVTVNNVTLDEINTRISGSPLDWRISIENLSGIDQRTLNTTGRLTVDAPVLLQNKNTGETF